MLRCGQFHVNKNSYWGPGNYPISHDQGSQVNVWLSLPVIQEKAALLAMFNITFKPSLFIYSNVVGSVPRRPPSPISRNPLELSMESSTIALLHLNFPVSRDELTPRTESRPHRRIYSPATPKPWFPQPEQETVTTNPGMPLQKG